MFNTFFLAPVYNVVVFFLNLFPSHDIGVAIILTTIAIKIILLKLNLSSQRSAYLIKDAQTELAEIKKKYEGDSKKIAEETMRIYKEKKIKPFSSILVVLIQIPIFFALFYVFRDGGVTLRPDLIYSFNNFPETVKNLAFGFMNLSQKYIWVGVLTGITMFILSKRQSLGLAKTKDDKKTTNKKEDFQAVFSKTMQMQMTYFLPVISGISAAVLPSAIGVYWTTNNILSLFQDIYIKRKLKKEGEAKRIENK
ncbi:Membrane protein insertase YidC 2 [bioreactor metagenome]|uniref:Membrane protein insertase YidC 2 n=1 Tax=bioreactor metagenome TaxID=1076179 RepID=A0A644UA96_9ZZZZ|nr:YidC/Oxa1 family membrane protein insertase [Candidatus Elulimicrobiales bacterium]